MNFRNVMSCVGAVGLMVIASACGSQKDSSQTSSVAASGLRVIEMDEAEGKLVAEFAKDGRTIKFDLRLGPKMENPPSAEDLAKDPELPSFEVDAQVIDAKGMPFQQQMGGDHYIDTSWRMPHVENFDPAGRAKDFTLVRDAIEPFRQLALPQGLEQLRFTAIQLGHSIDHLADKDGAVPTTAPTAPTGGDGTLADKSVGIAWSNNTSVHHWDYRVRHHSLLGGAAWHSAIQLRGFDGNYGIAYTAHSCNHGSCAMDSNMSDHCILPGYLTDDGTHSRWFMSETNTSTSVSGGCNTGYGWNSTYSHNCNDDAQLQRDAIKYDAQQDADNNECHDFGTHTSSPNCN